MVEKDRLNVLFWGIIVISTLVLMAVPIINSFSPTYDPTFSMVFLVIFGVIDLTAVLTIAGKAFTKTGMACKDEALGLPSGSIRALIALSLIIIFAIMAIFMYNQLTPAAAIVHVPANQTLVYPNGTILTNPNGIYLMTEPSQAQKDFSAQTLTTVSTLVVALAGFYFGTKAVTTAKGSEAIEDEYSLTIEPEGAVNYEKDKPVSIEVKTEPKGEKFKFTVDGDNQDSIKMGDVSNKLIYTPSTQRTKNTVNVGFTLEGKPEVSKKLSIMIGKLEATSSHTGKLKEGESMDIEVKNTPENQKVKPYVYGDIPESLADEHKGKYKYTPSAKTKGRSGNNVLLVFELEGTPKISESLKVEVEDKP